MEAYNLYCNENNLIRLETVSDVIYILISLTGPLASLSQLFESVALGTSPSHSVFITKRSFKIFCSNS
jgi:hypothetical protein